MALELEENRQINIAGWSPRRPVLFELLPLQRAVAGEPLHSVNGNFILKYFEPNDHSMQSCGTTARQIQQHNSGKLHFVLMTKL